MDLYIQIIVVACLTGMTSLLAHRSAVVFMTVSARSCHN